MGALGEGFRPVWSDVMGEQGLRIVLEDWAHRMTAKEGAAGWGGDRMVVARRDGEGGRRGFAAAWHVVLDTAEDAVELSEILRSKLGSGCRERPDMGGFAWKARGRDVVIAAGPYERAGKEVKAVGGCAVTVRWVEVILKEGERGAKGAGNGKEKREGVLSGDR